MYTLLQFSDFKSLFWDNRAKIRLTSPGLLPAGASSAEVRIAASTIGSVWAGQWEFSARKGVMRPLMIRSVFPLNDLQLLSSPTLME